MKPLVKNRFVSYKFSAYTLIFFSAYGIHDISATNKEQSSKSISSSKILHLSLPNDSESPRTLKNYVPAGSYASAVVEEDITIPTSLDSASESLEIKLKLKDDINVPGGHRITLEDAKILGTCKGVSNINSPRAACEIHTISFRGENGSKETPIKGWLVGEDGVYGIPLKSASVKGNKTDIVKSGRVIDAVFSEGFSFKK